MNYAKIIYDALSTAQGNPVAPLQMLQEQEPPFVVFNIDSITPLASKVKYEPLDLVTVTCMTFDVDLDRAQTNANLVRVAFSGINNGLIQNSWLEYSAQEYHEATRTYYIVQTFNLRMTYRAEGVTLAGALQLIASASASITSPVLLQGGVGLTAGATGSLTAARMLAGSATLSANASLSFEILLQGSLALNGNASAAATVARMFAGSLQLNGNASAAATVARMLAGAVSLSGAASGDVTVSGGAFDTDYQAVINYATTQGYTLPSTAQQTLQNQLVLDLKAAGVWSRLDFFSIWATDADSDYATINWINPGTYNAIKVNSPTFTTDLGFTFDGVSSVLRLNTLAPDNQPLGSQNDASYGVYKMAGGSGMMAGVNSINNNRFACGVSTTNQLRINQGAAFNGTARTVSTAQGLKIITRPDATQWHIFDNGTQITEPTSSNTPDTSVYTFGATSNVFGTCQLGMGFVGKDLTSQAAGFKTAMDTYISSL